MTGRSRAGYLPRATTARCGILKWEMATMRSSTFRRWRRRSRPSPLGATRPAQRQAQRQAQRPAQLAAQRPAPPAQRQSQRQTQLTAQRRAQRPAPPPPPPFGSALQSRPCLRPSLLLWQLARPISPRQARSRPISPRQARSRLISPRQARSRPISPRQAPSARRRLRSMPRYRYALALPQRISENLRESQII